MGVCTHHVNELGYGEAKLDDDDVRGVWYGPGPLVVTDKELLEEFVLGVRVSLLIGPGCKGSKQKSLFQTTAFLLFDSSRNLI